MNVIKNTDILKLIPQRAPMVMVSGLYSAAEKEVSTFLRIKEGNIFVRDGKLQESGIIENIAQSAAAMNGYRALASGEPVQNGYIGAIKNLEISVLPACGALLVTKVREIYNVMDASIIEAEVRNENVLVARCEMKVFMQA
jgi:predicted hotdog family 3-hydroxylacyl-ACP dehydratase